MLTIIVWLKNIYLTIQIKLKLHILRIFDIRIHLMIY